MENLHHRRALVTGAAKRIGRSLALGLAAAGADVAITYNGSKAEAQETVEALQQLNVRAMAVACDVRNIDSVQAAVAAVVEQFGGLDILVNNAGTFETAALQSITLAQWDKMFETNTRGPFLMAQAAYPHLREARGRIINIGSLGGIHPWPTHAHYCTSKAALHMLTQTMAKAFAPEVSVNCVAPGWIAFPEAATDPDAPEAPFAQAADRGQSARFAAKTPMGRNGSADDVAQAVLFFATGLHFITGQTLAVDGGLGLS